MARKSSEYLSAIGKKGGLATLKKKGAKFFAAISLKRKKFGGGRPRKNSNHA